MVAIFVGRIGVFEKGLGNASDAELIKLKITYGDCEPSATAEVTFKTDFSQSQSDAEKELAIARFKDVIDQCDALSNARESCEASGCRWS